MNKEEVQLYYEQLYMLKKQLEELEAELLFCRPTTCEDWGNPYIIIDQVFYAKDYPAVHRAYARALYRREKADTGGQKSTQGS